MGSYRRLFWAEARVFLWKGRFLLRLFRLNACSWRLWWVTSQRLGVSWEPAAPHLITTGLSLRNPSVEERYLTFFGCRDYNWWPVSDVIKYGKKRRDAVGGLCPELQKLASSSVIQSSHLSCFYMQGTNKSFVLRKHLVPWELLNLVSVCTCVCMSMHLWGVHYRYMCMLYGCVCVCMCIYVYVYLCVQAHVCTCMYVCIYVYIYTPCLTRKEVYSIASGPGDDLIIPGSSCHMYMEMAKPFQTQKID